MSAHEISTSGAKRNKNTKSRPPNKLPFSAISTLHRRAQTTKVRVVNEIVISLHTPGWNTEGTQIRTSALAFMVSECVCIMLLHACVSEFYPRCGVMEANARQREYNKRAERA